MVVGFEGGGVVCFCLAENFYQSCVYIITIGSSIRTMSAFFFSMVVSVDQKNMSVSLKNMILKCFFFSIF